MGLHNLRCTEDEIREAYFRSFRDYEETRHDGHRRAVQEVLDRSFGRAVQEVLDRSSDRYAPPNALPPPMPPPGDQLESEPVLQSESEPGSVLQEEPVWQPKPV